MINSDHKSPFVGICLFHTMVNAMFRHNSTKLIKFWNLGGDYMEKFSPG